METKRKGPANGLGIPLTCCVRACVHTSRCYCGTHEPVEKVEFQQLRNIPACVTDVSLIPHIEQVPPLTNHDYGRV